MVGVHDYRMEGLLPSKAWQPGLGAERQTVAFIQDRGDFPSCSFKNNNTSIN